MLIREFEELILIKLHDFVMDLFNKKLCHCVIKVIDFKILLIIKAAPLCSNHPHHNILKLAAYWWNSMRNDKEEDDTNFVPIILWHNYFTVDYNTHEVQVV